MPSSPLLSLNNFVLFHLLCDRAPLASRPELGEGGTLRPVVDLLVEQVECADFVVLNKTDLLQGSEQLEQLVSIVSMFNPLATVIPCERGKVGSLAPAAAGTEAVACATGSAAATGGGGGSVRDQLVAKTDVWRSHSWQV